MFSELHSVVRQHLFHFSLYDFLWKDDMRGNYADFLRHDPGSAAITREVQRLLNVEQKVKDIPDVLQVACICLNTGPVKNALHGFAMAWKTQYGSILHEEAKVEFSFNSFVLIYHFVNTIYEQSHEASDFSNGCEFDCVTVQFWSGKSSVNPPLNICIKSAFISRVH